MPTEKESDQHNCENCATSVRLAALEEGLKKVNAEHKEFFDRIRAIEVTGAIQSERYDIILERIERINESVETLTSAPGKKWEAAVDKVIFTVIGAVVAFILTQLGLQ